MKDKKSRSSKTDARYWSRREAGLCVDCGEPSDGSACCTPCIAIRKEKYFDRTVKARKKRQESGLCVRCGAPVESEGGSSCDACRAARKHYDRKREDKAGIVRKRHLSKEAWDAVDWTRPTLQIAAELGVTENTVRWQRRKRFGPAKDYKKSLRGGLSKQRKWQIEQIKKGLCYICARKTTYGRTTCDYHREKQRQQRIRKAKEAGCTLIPRRHPPREQWDKVDWENKTPQEIADELGVTVQAVYAQRARRMPEHSSKNSREDWLGVDWSQFIVDIAEQMNVGCATAYQVWNRLGKPDKKISRNSQVAKDWLSKKI